MEFANNVVWLITFLVISQIESWKSKTTDNTSGAVIIYALAGKTISIPCNAHSSPKGDSVALILWYKDNSTTPVYSLDARQGTLDQARHAVKDPLKSRAFLNILTEPAVLKFGPVRVADEGEYRCRADFRNERTRYSTITVKVIVEPEKPVIKDNSGEILQSLIGPYNEGDELLLICEVKGGRPLPTVTWWRETVLLDDTYKLVPSNYITNELKISTLQRHDLMAVFTCQASNNNISMPLFSSVTVDMNFRPLLVSIDGENKPMAASQQVELICRAIGSRPPALLSWWLGMRELKSIKDTISVDGNLTTSILSFNPSRIDNGEYLACRAENPLILNSAIEYGWTLNILYIPHVSLRLSGPFQHSPIHEGSDVYMYCDVESNPPPTQIKWKFEKQQLFSNRTAGVIIANRSLILQNVDRLDIGEYTCAVTNSQGRKESEPLQLRIQYAPVCVHQGEVVYRGDRNVPLRVTCEVEADPQPLIFLWKVNISMETGQMATFIKDGPHTITTSIQNTEEEFGTIECWGKNSVGEQTVPCTYIILPADVPEDLKSCIVSNQTETSFLIYCVEGYNGGVNQIFILEVYNAATKLLLTNQTSDFALFTVHDLQPGEYFQINVYSMNSVGKSRPYILNASTLTSPSSLTRIDGKWQVDFSPTFLLLTILSVGIAASICIAVAVVKVKHKMARRRDDALSGADDKCQTPLRKDTDDECKSGAFGGDEKGPDIIPGHSNRALSFNLVETCKDEERNDAIFNGNLLYPKTT